MIKEDHFAIIFPYITISVDLYSTKSSPRFPNETHPPFQKIILINVNLNLNGK